MTSTVRIKATAYVAGDLPDVCVVSGVPTLHRITLTSRLDPRARGRGVVAVLRRFIDRIGDLRPDGPPPHLVLQAEVPMRPEEISRFARDRRGTRLMAWVAGGALVIAAWSGTPWSPVVASLSAAGLAGALIWAWRRSRRWPVADIDASGRWVTLYRTHAAFVAAVGDDAAAGEKEQ